MLKKHQKKIITAILGVSMLCQTIPTLATQLEQAQSAKATAEKDLEEVNKEIKAINEEKSKLEEEINSLDSELIQLLVDVEILKEEIQNTKDSIIEAEDAFNKAKAAEQVQIDAMKLRIQYLYENGDSDILSAIFTSDDFSEVLNKTELSNQVYEYDREQLQVFEEVRLKVQNTLEELLNQQSLLAETENSFIEQQKELGKLLEEKKNTSEEFNKRLEDAQELANNYKKVIVEQNAIIAQYQRPKYTASYEKIHVEGTGKGVEIANYAIQFVGNPYVWGGTSLTNGCDCSGFTQSVYKHFGINISRMNQKTQGYGVTVPEPGDIICYSGHVAIYIGDGKIVHASSPQVGIIISNNYLYKPVVAIRRIVD